MQHVPALARVAVAVELLVAGHAPDVGRDVVLLEHLLRRENLVQDRPAAKQLRREPGLGVPGLAHLVHSFEDAFTRALGHRRHLVLLVHHRDVVEDVLLLLVHPADALLDDHRDLVSECRVVRHAVGITDREHVAVAVLVLQPFPRQRRPAGGAPEEEPAGA